MKCPQCSHELANHEKFCTQCGTNIDTTHDLIDKFCTACGQAMEVHLKFCTHCGSARKLDEPIPTAIKPDSKISQKTETVTPSRQPISSPKQEMNAAATNNLHQPIAPVTAQQEIASTGKSKKLIWVVTALIIVLAAWLMLRSSDKESPEQSSSNSENAQGTSSKKGKRSVKPSIESFTAQQLVDANTKEDLVKFKEISHGLQQQQKPEVGDKKLARKLNSDALEALRAKSFSDAVSTLQKAYETNPADIEVSDNLAYALLLAGNAAKAEAQEMITLQYAPERASAWANLAEASARQGKTKQAIAAYLAGYRYSKKPESFLEALKANLNNPDYEASKSVLNTVINKIENSN
jgi:Flp pilus assembly protein TadD